MKRSLLRAVFVRYRRMIVSIIAVSCLCCGMVVSSLNAYSSLSKTYEFYLKDYGIADAVISTEITEESAVETLASVPGVAAAESRLTGTAHFYTSSGRMLIGNVSTLHEENIQKLFRREQESGMTGDYLLIDYRFAENNGLRTGDELLVRRDGGDRSFRIAAIVSSPETLAGSRLEGLGGLYTDIGYVYVPASLLDTETEIEFRRMMAEWEEKQEALLQAREEAQKAWEEGEMELAGAKEELESREAEFEQSRKELREKISTLTNARMQLVLGKKDLEEAEAAAAEKKVQLEQGLARAEEQLLELEDREAELEEIRNDLNSLLVRLEDARGRLITARNQLSGSESELQTTLTVMREVKKAWDQVRTQDGETGLPDIVDQQAEISVAELEEKLGQRGITPESLEESIQQAETGANQLRTGSGRIQYAIGQINRDYLPELLDYLEETEQGLEVIAGSRTALQEGIAKMQEGLASIRDFEAEAPESREELAEKLQEVENGLRTIYGAIEEAESALEEVREKLAEETGKAERARLEAEKELSDGADSLNSALEELNAWEGYTPLRNEFLLAFDPDVPDRQAVLEAAKATLGEIVTGAVLMENSMVSSRIRDNLEPWDAMAFFLPLLFAALVMLVVFLFLSMMIRQSRRENGILRALGFRIGEIRALYCTACLLMIIPALILGALISIPLRDIYNDYYIRFIGFPYYVGVFDWKAFAWFSAVLIAVTQAAALAATSAVNGIHPAESMSRQFSAVRGTGEKGERLIRKMKPMTKLSIRSLERNRLRFIASSVCIAAAVGVLFTSLAITVSKNRMQQEILEGRMRYDCQAFFSVEPSQELEREVRELSCVQRLEKIRLYTVVAASGNRTARIPVTALGPESSLLIVPDERGEAMTVPENGIILEANQARKLALRPGDPVTVNGAEMTVKALSRQTGMMSSYLSDSQASDLGEPSQYAWLLQTDEDNAELFSLLEREESFVMTVWMETLRSSLRTVMESFDIFTGITLVFAVSLGMFIVINTNQTNLLEQKRELSILRALGFQRSEISKHWFSHSLLYFLCAAAIGIPAGMWITEMTVARLSNDNRQLFFVSEPYLYWMTAGILFLFLTAAHFWSMRILKKWDVAENVRDME